MKQKDIAPIILIVAISAIVSFFISKQIFASPKNRQQEVEVVKPISPDFPQPDKRYFNNKAFDPIQLITIGKNSNPNPFSTKPQ